MSLDKCLNYLITKHNLNLLCDPNIEPVIPRPTLYLPKFLFSDESYFNKILINPNNCILCFPTMGYGFILNIFEVEKIHLFKILLNGTGDINSSNYEIYNLNKKKFISNKNEGPKKKGCKLLNINLDIFIYKEIFVLIPSILKYVNKEGNVLKSLLIECTSYSLPINFRNCLDDDIIYGQINELCNIFGINIIE